jgi:OmpA-OmpF porin, OOP family
MKTFTALMLILLGLAQVNFAQDTIRPTMHNNMSNVVGATFDFGVTLGFTDYTSNKINYMGRLSLEYYLPSLGHGNIGFRGFFEEGFIGGTGAPALSPLGTPSEFKTRMNIYGGGIVYILSLGDVVYPWVGLGVSNMWFYPKDGNGNQSPNFAANNYSHNIFAWNGDAGIRFMISRVMSFNLTAGAVIPSTDWLDDIKYGANNDVLYTLKGGFTYYFGRDKDSDGDGVPDSRDACPDTPLGVKVDQFGCPLDSDGDGVPDYMDKCANTPTGVKVDATGCPLDSDGDGVPDYLDKCPNTPTGVVVDAAGCPLDSDGDGVPDYLDKCPNTPTGVQVDADGCPIKKDRDTVIIKQPAEIESLILSGDTNFEFNKANLLPNAYSVLDSLVGTMKRHPGYVWEIGGHTDGIGSAKYNYRLSKQRAQAVVDYLVSKGIASNNLTIVGYGKDKPIATNDTNEGRSMNRRVEIKLISKDNK